MHLSGKQTNESRSLAAIKQLQQESILGGFGPPKPSKQLKGQMQKPVYEIVGIEPRI